ncbi:6671_t:CDS:2, partial [Racocetra fulgida]
KEVTEEEKNDIKDVLKVLGKKEEKKKILIEHWQIQSRDNELSTEISRCDRCISEDKQVKDG